MRKHDGKHSLSIYLPKADNDTGSDQTKIRAKNAVQQARFKLTSAKLSDSDVDDRVKMIEELVQNGELWPPPRASLAIFSHPELSGAYLIPLLDSPFNVYHETGFNLGPVNQIFEQDRSFYLLSLNLNNVQFYKGDLYGIEELQPKELPRSLSKALRIDELPSSLQSHSVGRTGRGGTVEGKHGQYNVNEVNKTMTTQFLRLIEDFVGNYLKDSDQPLILGGTKQIVSEYRKLSNYQETLEEGIEGNLEGKLETELWQEAWGILDIPKLGKL